MVMAPAPSAPANSLPCTLEPAKVIVPPATTVPWKMVPVPFPIVAVAVITQKTFLGWAPPCRITLPVVVVMSLAWKIKTASGLPFASSTRGPLILLRPYVSVAARVATL